MDFVRIIPAQRFTGLPAPAHRPYTFYADAVSLHGRTVAECYRLVKGLTLPPRAGYWQKECRSPYAWGPRTLGDLEAPLAKLCVSAGGAPTLEEAPADWFVRTKYVVLGVGLDLAEAELDVFPATWGALAYIVSDPARMGSDPPVWTMSPTEFASARVHALFREAHRTIQPWMLAELASKQELGLTELDKLPEPEQELKHYHYLSVNSALTNEIIELFGISHRCWHGCGYLGWPGFPLCRFFLLRNLLVKGMDVRIMGGSERFMYDPSKP